MSANQLIKHPVLSRRGLLGVGAAAGLMAPLGLLPRRGLAQGAGGQGTGGQGTGGLKHLKLAWNPNAVCVSPIAVAFQTNLFAKHGLEVEVVSYAGSSEQLLESIATGKADAGIGMILRWLKPLEQGFDVKLAAGTHAGCTRFLGYRQAGVTNLDQIKGKTIGVNDQGSPAKHVLSIMLAKRGINPETEVQWRVYPADLLQLAAEKGEIQVIAHWDPDTYRFLKTGAFVEVANTNDGEYRDRVCCVVGLRGKLLQEDRDAARSLVAALLEAHNFAAAKPDESSRIYVDKYQAKNTPQEITDQLISQNHASHPQGDELRRQVAEYADELKLISVFRQGLDTAKFASRVTADLGVG